MHVTRQIGQKADVDVHKLCVVNGAKSILLFGANCNVVNEETDFERLERFKGLEHIISKATGTQTGCCIKVHYLNPDVWRGVCERSRCLVETTFVPPVDDDIEASTGQCLSHAIANTGGGAGN